MKEATGELNMTVITVVAIAAIVGIFTVFILPSIQEKLKNNVNAAGDTFSAVNANDCSAKCTNRGFKGGYHFDDKDGTCTCKSA